MRRMIYAIIGAAVMAAITAGVVLALNYEGEDFCQHAPAWPGGTYLGQMHPFHSDFYRGYAERRGWDPCTTWAVDQQNSAIRGLRELGYTVTARGELPVSGNEITLTDGLWTVAYSVTGNRGSFGSGGTNFIVEIEAVAGGWELIANEIGTSVNGRTTMRVGSEILSLSAGKAVVSVEASAAANWTVMLTKQ